MSALEQIRFVFTCGSVLLLLTSIHISKSYSLLTSTCVYVSVCLLVILTVKSEKGAKCAEPVAAMENYSIFSYSLIDISVVVLCCCTKVERIKNYFKH